MARRCGFYVANGTVERCDVEIPWNLGFGEWAKLGYIDSLYDALGKRGHYNCLDVTTANTTSQNGRILSPRLMKYKDTTVEEFYQGTKETINVQLGRMLYFEWLYLNHIPAQGIEMIKRYDTFTDVFHRPGGYHSTQAKSCAVYKLLMQLGKEDMIKDVEAFYRWRSTTIAWES